MTPGESRFYFPLTFWLQNTAVLGLHAWGFAHALALFLRTSASCVHVTRLELRCVSPWSKRFGEAVLVTENEGLKRAGTACRGAE